jgi:hypothetical protein
VDSCPCLIHTTISHPIFFSRIEHFYKSKPNSEYHIFDSSFLYNLHSRDYNDVKKFTRKLDVFQKHVLLMPMCTNVHWILYVVVNPHQCGKVLDNHTNGPVILCLDSLGKGCSGVESSIRNFLEKEWTKSRNHAHLAFPFSKKNIPLLIPTGSLLVFPVFFGMHYHQSKLPNKFSSTFCFSLTTRERLRLWCVCVSVYACYCSFISGFSRRNTFAKKRWMGKFR